MGMVLGGASSLTGTILANVPGIGADTPINLTLALTAGGLGLTATLAWKVSRAWSKIENTLARVEERLSALEKTKA